MLSSLVFIVYSEPERAREREREREGWRASMEITPAWGSALRSVLSCLKKNEEECCWVFCFFLFDTSV